MEEAPVIFQGIEETLSIVDTGGDLVRYLTRKNPICPLIGSRIKLLKKLGEGVAGAAFLISIEGLGEKEYVVKKSQTFAETRKWMHVPHALKDVAKIVSKQVLVPAETVIALNGGDPEHLITRGDPLFIPSYAEICLLSEDLTVKRFDTGEYITTPPGSYVCEENAYSEYVNSLLAGQLYQQGKSMNFFSVFEFATCPDHGDDPEEVYQYTFMEKIDDTLRGILNDVLSEEHHSVAAGILVQTLHAIATYQHNYKLSHNDLHDDNVFIEYVTEKTEFGGEKLIDADYYHYRIDDVDIYIPASKYIVKIGDWGLSVKWSAPIVGDRTSMIGGYDQDDGGGPWVPNWYSANYDSTFITSRMWLMADRSGFSHPFLKRAWATCINLHPDISDDDLMEVTERTLQRNTRVKLDLLHNFTHADAANLLTNSGLMGSYLTRPSSGKIVTLGVI